MLSNYLSIKKEVALQLAQVDSFEIQFNTPSTCNAFKFVTAGSTRKFKRTAQRTFKMGQARDVISAASIAHVIAHNEGVLVINNTK